MPTAITGGARAQDGCGLFYSLHPRPGKPRLVLIHSLALDATIWEGVVEELSADFEILVYDCRGHGQSEHRRGSYTAELFADDLRSLLDQCNWQDCIIGGCSMGGCVAQAFAVAHPNRAQALALLDTTAWYGPTAIDDWRKRARKAEENGFAAMLPFQLSRWFGDRFREAHAERVEEMSRVFLANDVACYQSSCALLGNADLRGGIGSLRIPASIIVGEEDYATPLAMSQTMKGLIADSTLTVIPGARHLTPVQCPREVAALLRNLAAKL
jgi:3-oxoadipate enol-lactonase